MEQDLAIDLYKVFRGEMYESYKLHRESLQNYLTFVAAILGATIAASLQIRGIGWIGLVVLVGPLLNVLVCLLAIRMCDRFYLGAMERVTIMAKLESIIGIRDDKWKTTIQDKNVAFPKDKYLLPERWMQGQQNDTAEEFIRLQQNAGVNRLAKLTFHLMTVINILLGIVAVCAALL